MDEYIPIQKRLAGEEEKKRRIMVPNFAEIHVIVESEKMVPISPLPNPTGKVDM